MTAQPKTPAEIYLVPDTEHGLVWSHDPAPGEGMREEDATRYVREDLVPESNTVLSERIADLTRQNSGLQAQVEHSSKENERLKKVAWDALCKADDLVYSLKDLRTAVFVAVGRITDIEVKQHLTRAFNKVPEDIRAAQHPDDNAVDRFASAMKTKLAAARAKGRSGWTDKENCSGDHLAQLLVEHLSKSNPGTFEDVANFAMMLHQRDEDPKLLFIALATHIATMYVHQTNSDTAEVIAQAIRSFVSDTNEAGQLSWSDAQWLEDWRDEWLSQSAKAGAE